jgi:hypothetical protein
MNLDGFFFKPAFRAFPERIRELAPTFGALSLLFHQIPTEQLAPH